MTTEEILKLEPSPELDACIAEIVYGYSVIWLNTGLGYYPFIWEKEAQKGDNRYHLLVGGHWIQGITRNGEQVEIYGAIVPKYSEDIASAWEIENELSKKGWKIHFHRFGDGFNCYFHHPSKMTTTTCSYSTSISGAISKAALLAALEILAQV
ncbi:MAG: BC1872 family protein [Bacillota bacterium]